jgi:hypothetical protein
MGFGRDLEGVIESIWWVCIGKLALVENGKLESEVGD